jgi:hypothetical protein
MVWFGGETRPPGKLGWRPQTHNRTQWGTVRGVLPVRLVRTQARILGLPLSGKRGAWSTPRVTWVTLSKSKAVTPRHWVRGRNRCLRVNMCEWDIAWLQSECRVLIHGSLVNSYGLRWALTGPLVRDLYRLTMTKRHLSPYKGSSQRQMKWVVLFALPCVSERSTPYLLSTTFIPSISISVLISGNGRSGRRSE